MASATVCVESQMQVLDDSHDGSCESSCNGSVIGGCERSCDDFLGVSAIDQTSELAAAVLATPL